MTGCLVPDFCHLSALTNLAAPVMVYIPRDKRSLNGLGMTGQAKSVLLPTRDATHS